MNASNVTTITHRDPPEPVYNLEVDAEHVYRVGNRGVLVHNTWCVSDAVPDPRKSGYYDPGSLHVDHTLARALGGLDVPGNRRNTRAALNLRKGGIEGSLVKYVNKLESAGMSREHAMAVIESELIAIGRDALPTPISNFRGKLDSVFVDKSQ